MGAAATLSLTALPGSAAAAPGDPVTQATTAEQATALVADATHQLEVNSEALNEVKETLAQQQAAADAAEQARAQAAGQRAALDDQMRQVARSAFTGENLSRFNALMTSGSADEFISQVSTLDAIAGHTDGVLAQVTAAETAAEQAKAAAAAATAAAQQTLTDVTAKQDDLNARIADYQAQYDALSAAQQQAVVEEHAGPVLDAPEPASAGTSSTRAPARSSVQSSAQTSTADAVQAGSAAAQTAVDTALAQLGDPYVWGAAGPSAFDCSGLTQYAYAAAGIALPHSSRIQSTMGAAVSRADLQPGDLVFFYSPVSHVGMYIGGGKMVHASTFGSPVLVTSVDMAGYVGARRLIG